MTIKLYHVATILALTIFVASQQAVEINDADDAEMDDTEKIQGKAAEFLLLVVFFIKPKELDVFNAADADMDGKTSLAEAADMLYGMYFKVTADDLILLDADHDGYLTEEDVKNFNLTNVIEIMDPGENQKPRIEKVFDFFNKYGVDMYGFPKTEIGSRLWEEIPRDGRLDTEMVGVLAYAGLLYHFIDQSMIRSQLAVTGVMRLLFVNAELTKLFSETDNDTLSSQSVVKFFRMMFIKFTKKDFPDRISASDIRYAEVTRKNFFWPTADANGMFPLGQVEKFWDFNGLIALDFYNYKNKSIPSFEVDIADLDHDGFLNAHELHEWLGESDRVFFDEYYVNVKIAGARHLLNRVANMFEAYLNGKNVLN